MTPKRITTLDAFRMCLAGTLFIGATAWIAIEFGISWILVLVILYIFGTPILIFLGVRFWVRFRSLNPLPESAGASNTDVFRPHAFRRKIRYSIIEVALLIAIGVAASPYKNPYEVAAVLPLTVITLSMIGFLYSQNTYYIRIFRDVVWIKGRGHKVVLSGELIESFEWTKVGKSDKVCPVFVVKSSQPVVVKMFTTRQSQLRDLSSTASVLSEKVAALIERSSRID